MVKYCYERALKHAAEASQMSDDLNIEFSITDGVVKNIQLVNQTTSNIEEISKELNDCSVQKVRKWKFSKDCSEDQVGLIFSFSLK